MKKTIFVIYLLLLLPVFAGAQPQDARQRTVETVVADGLAQLPADKPEVFREVMGELAATGNAGVEQIARLLVPAAQGKNATVEYALSGIVAYVTAPGQEALRTGVRKGLLAALAACWDNANRAFLLSQLQLCATSEDGPALAAYLDDPYLGDYALRALASTPETEPLLLSLAEEENLAPARKRALAHAFADKRLPTAEPILLGWLDGADAATSTALYGALAVCGTSLSIGPLADAAARVNYAAEPTGVTDAFLRLLTARAQDDGASVAKAVKPLLKSDRESVRGAALGILVQAQGLSKATPVVLKAIKEGPAKYRFAALETLGKGNDELFAQVAAGMSRYDAEAQRAVITWLGERHAASQIAVVAAAVSSPDDRVAVAAIEASGRIGGEEALSALIGALDGPFAARSAEALLAFNGNIDAEVGKLLRSDNPQVLVQALRLAAARRMTPCAERVFDLLKSPDAAVAGAAYEALGNVVLPAQADEAAALLDKVGADRVKPVQTALIHALRNLPVTEQYTRTEGYMRAAKTPARYYPVLAQTGTDAAVGLLLTAFGTENREAAFAALLTVENPSMPAVLYDLADRNPACADAAIARYTDLVAASGDTGMRCYQLYRRALALNLSAPTRNKLLRALAATSEFPAVMLAAGYLTDPATDVAAAAAVKTLIARHPETGGAAVIGALKKALAVYVRQAETDADAGYAVDEIKGLLAKLPADGYTAATLDPSEWTAVVGNPETRRAMKSRTLAKAQQAADAAKAEHWSLAEGVLTGAVGGGVLGSGREYGNFELIVDWKSEGEAGLGIRSIPRIALGGQHAGMLTGNEPVANAAAVAAANRPGAWNTLQVKVVNDRVTVLLNGIATCENVVLENSCNPEIPAYAEGRILLIAGDAPVSFRDLYIHELPATPRFALAAAEAAEGFESLFDGLSLHSWTGNTVNYVPYEGTIDVTASYGGEGNLYTKKEYGDFILRFEFRFLREGVNNGIGIRTPMGVDAAYHGMEIQVLDHDAPIYKDLHVYQQHGSVYGVIPAKRVEFPPLGEWNTEEIRAVGDRITVTVNGDVILDGDIREACQGHNVAPDGSDTNPYTADRRNHPGLFNDRGHIGLLGHGTGLQFRNLRIREIAPGKSAGK